MIKLSDKIISSIVGVVIAAGTITVAATSTQPKAVSAEASSVASEAVSSTVPSSSIASSSPVVSSKTEVSNVADGVDAIQKATDEGVEKIHSEADKAVKQVQDNAPKASTHKLTATGKIAISSTGSTDESKSSAPEEAWIKVIQSSFQENETEKFVVIGYAGYLGEISDLKTAEGLKKMGFEILDANGKSLDFTDYRNSMRIKVPYTNLSDISTLYLSYQGQKITITIS